MKRTILASVLAVSLNACAGTTVDPSTIVVAVQSACQFTTTIQMIQQVVASFVGQGGTITADIAAQVENAICAAVQQKVPSLPPVPPTTAGAARALPVITINVHGVDIHGTYGRISP